MPVFSDETNSKDEKIVVTSVEPENVYIIGKNDDIKNISDVYTKTIYTSDITETQTIVAQLDLSQLPEGVSVENQITDVKITLGLENNNQQGENGGDQ